jgi:hypothetical protein
VPTGYWWVPRVCWVLDGVLRCASVREHVRVCVQCACAFARVLICVFMFICVRARCVRARVSVRVCVPLVAHVCVVRAFPSDCIFSLVCVANACARLAAACALPSHGARGCGSVRSAGLARVGRRCELDVPHGQRAVGCAI